MSSHFHQRPNHNNNRNQLLQIHFQNIQNLSQIIRDSQRLLQPIQQQQHRPQSRRLPIYDQYNNNFSNMNYDRGIPQVYSIQLDRGLFQSPRPELSYRTHHVDSSNTIIPENADILIYNEYRFIENPINEICPITRESFFQNQRVSMIKNCRHIFNKDALQIWLANNPTCPTCRSNITSSSSLRVD